MTTDKPLSAEELEYDVFSYDGPMKQCISGFVRNALEIEPPLTVDQRDSLEWSLNEMARWCRHFLSEIDRLNAEREWVSVETRLPQEKVIVFVLCGEELFPASGMLDEGYWRDGIIALSDVRMWREVNLPVQEGEKK